MSKPRKKKKREKVIGGLADGLPDYLFDKTQVKIGIDVEKEHSNDKEIQEEIAKDHLVEFDEYYKYLADMETIMEAKEKWTKVAKIDKKHEKSSMEDVEEAISGIMPSVNVSRDESYHVTHVAIESTAIKNVDMKTAKRLEQHLFGHLLALEGKI